MAKPPAKPKAIIFDCWNTLFYAKQRPLVLRLITASKLLDRSLSYGLLKRFERSIMLAPEANIAATARKMLRGFGLPALPGLVGFTQRALRDAHRQVYPDSFEVLRQLGRDYKLGLITNSFEVAFEPLRQQFKLDDYFDVITTSYEAGVLKPDPKIFTLALQQLGVRPAEAIMVGDNPRDDVKAAEALGMTGILVDRRRRHLQAPRRVESLSELPELLRLMGVNSP